MPCSDTKEGQNYFIQDPSSDYEHDVSLVSVVFNCPVDASADWEGAEIFATLSLSALAPPPDVFLSVVPLPVLDVEKHRLAQGTLAVCLPPLTGDLYAPFIADYIAYYQALGFDHFYTYVLDPGPRTLETLRRVANADASIQPIRFGLHQGLKNSAKLKQKPKRAFRVKPSQWDLPDLGRLPDHVEFEMGDGSDEKDIRLWYYGQSIAQADCQLRAMRDGHRWVFNGDWDEYLLLKPAGASAWAPFAASSPNSAFTDWARSVEKLWSWPETMPRMLAGSLGFEMAVATRGTMPASFTFLTSWGCIECTPTPSEPPASTSTLQQVASQLPSVDWISPGTQIPLALVSPVRRDEWMIQGVRSKAIVDPWAWWSLAIHHAGLGYAHWAITRGFCSPLSSTTHNKNAAARCARDLLWAFGRDTVIVRPPSASSNITESKLSDYGLGALYHFRVGDRLSRALSSLKAAQDTKPSRRGIPDDEGIRVLRQNRVDKTKWLSIYRDESKLVQDWTMLQVMGSALLDVIEHKKRFGPIQWFEKGARRKRKVQEARSLTQGRAVLIGVWLVLVLGFLGPLWRGRQLGAGTKNDPSMKEMHC